MIDLNIMMGQPDVEAHFKKKLYTGTENIERSGKTLSFRVIFENYLVTYESKTN